MERALGITFLAAGCFDQKQQVRRKELANSCWSEQGLVYYPPHFQGSECVCVCEQVMMWTL